MKKIDKSKGRKATAYKNWQEGLDEANQKHPTYNSSNGKFYQDIVMDLARAQAGLCAYTEKSLGFEPEDYADDRWVESEDGRRYANQQKQHYGQLEHFDATLKPEKGWSWDNFFLVHGIINSKQKGTKSVDPILKPDLPGYDPNEFLEYDEDTHLFTAKTDLDQDQQDRINTMIETLGLNFKAVQRERKRFLSDRLLLIEWRRTDALTPYDGRFQTALGMCLTQRDTEAAS